MYGKNDSAFVAEMEALEVTADYQDRILGMLEADVDSLKDDPYEALALILDILPGMTGKVGGPMELDVSRIQDMVFDLSYNLSPAIGRKMLKLVETFFMEGNLKEIGEMAILIVIALSSCSSLHSDTLRIYRRFMTRAGEMDRNLLSFMVSETVNAMMDSELPPEEIYAFASPYMDLEDVREEFSSRNWPLDVEEARKRPGGLKSLSWYIQIS